MGLYIRRPGYRDGGKSARAYGAEARGLLPEPKAVKYARTLGATGITAAILADSGLACEWHHVHTSREKYAEVNFYDPADIREGLDDLKEAIAAKRLMDARRKYARSDGEFFIPWPDDMTPAQIKRAATHRLTSAGWVEIKR